MLASVKRTREQMCGSSRAVGSADKAWPAELLARQSEGRMKVSLNISKAGRDLASQCDHLIKQSTKGE